MKVKVEQKHIDSGCRENAFRCPVALSLKEQTGVSWSVTSATAKEAGSGNTYWILPHDASRFVKAFDKGRFVKPFEFEMNKKGKV